jgi:hypothetical protein
MHNVIEELQHGTHFDGWMQEHVVQHIATAV